MVSKDAEFDCKIFSRLSKNLRENIVDVDGNKINVENVDPLGLVCVQISSNPGITPFLIINSEELSKFSNNLAEQIGLDLNEYTESLKLRLKWA